MNQSFVPLQESLQYGVQTTSLYVSAFLPRFVSALVIFLLGFLIAKALRRVVLNGLKALRVSRLVEKTPVELFLKNAEVGEKMEDLVSGVVYWMVLFLTFYTAVSVLGLSPLELIFERILSYIPHVVSAFFIFVLGVLLAGVVETLVKGTLKSLDGHSARLLAKLASYLVVTVSSLAAIAELGIASQFITVLFVGVVFAFSLGAGLALGLGGQETVRKILENWYKKVQN